MNSIVKLSLGLEAVEQRQHLRLDHDVERSGGLVGDEQRRARRPVPSR